MTILLSYSCGITVTKANISKLRREEIAVPENVLKSDDEFPTPSFLTFVFHVVDPWCKSGNFPVGRANLKMTPNPRIKHIYPLNLFMKLYLMDYIKDVVIPDTNKRIT